jgi:riboflavin biosynthesis pyrimidine reductase
LSANQLTDKFGVFDVSTGPLSEYFSALAAGPGVTAAIAISASGEHVDDRGGSAAFSSKTDRLWLKILRARADAVLTSGATVRAERLRQTESPFIIATASGDVRGLRIRERAELYISGNKSSHPSWPDSAQHFGEFDTALDVLVAAKLRWPRLQVELGYQNLIAGFERGLIDRLFVTAPATAAKPNGFGPLEELVSFDSLTLFRASR